MVNIQILETRFTQNQLCLYVPFSRRSPQFIVDLFLLFENWWIIIVANNVLLAQRYIGYTKQTFCEVFPLSCKIDFVAVVLRRSLTSQVISVASYIEHEKAYKFCSEALISAWGSFTCRKSTTRDPRVYFPSDGSHNQDFYALKKSIDPGRDRTDEPRIQSRVW